MSNLRYEAQVRSERPCGTGNMTDWRTLACHKALSVAANDSRVRDEMQRRGFHYGELWAHSRDLVAGHVLTAEDGTQFRVVRCQALGHAPVPAKVTDRAAVAPNLHVRLASAVQLTREGWSPENAARTCGTSVRLVELAVALAQSPEVSGAHA